MLGNRKGACLGELQRNECRLVDVLENVDRLSTGVSVHGLDDRSAGGGLCGCPQ